MGVSVLSNTRGGLNHMVNCPRCGTTIVKTTERGDENKRIEYTCACQTTVTIENP